MAGAKRRSEQSTPEGDSPALIGPFIVPDASGLGAVIPGPLTAGPPQPEPEERWTLGPRPETNAPQVQAPRSPDEADG